jgi:HSP20 family molecular chaperone IbpA
MWSFDLHAGRELSSDPGVDTLFLPWTADLGDLGVLTWHETSDAYFLEGRLEGFRRKHLRIEARDGALEVHAERGRKLRSRGRRSFHQRVTLPRGAAPEAMTASFDGARLSIRVPKRMCDAS